MIKRIAITGPESTGKSMLAEKLAEEFKTTWVPEYARQFLDEIDHLYTYQDILTIAKEQFHKINDDFKGSNQYVFFDTELLVTKIWCDFKYGKCHPWILETLDKQVVDLYLLTDVDLPWQPDPLREHPDKRNQLFELYKTELEKRNWPFEIISGFGEDRILNAIRAIRKWFH